MQLWQRIRFIDFTMYYMKMYQVIGSTSFGNRAMFRIILFRSAEFEEYLIDSMRFSLTRNHSKICYKLQTSWHLINFNFIVNNSDSFQLDSYIYSPFFHILFFICLLRFRVSNFSDKQYHQQNDSLNSWLWLNLQPPICRPINHIHSRKTVSIAAN